MFLRAFTVTCLLLLWTQHLYGQIVVTPAEPVAGEKTIAEVTAVVPPGAMFEGGWQVVCLSEGCQPPGTAELKQPNAIGMWCDPGRYLLMYNGYWKLVGPEITIKDVDGVEQKLRPFLGSGPVNNSLTLEVTPANPLPPPPEPDPPVPVPTAARGIIVFESENQTSQFGNLLVELRQAYPEGGKLLIIDQHQESQTNQKYVQAALEAPRGLPVLVVVAADGSVAGVVKVPDSVQGMQEILP
jgi:hypothetical protein